jgi:hypothetical protein
MYFILSGIHLRIYASAPPIVVGRGAEKCQRPSGLDYPGLQPVTWIHDVGKISPDGTME